MLKPFQSRALAALLLSLCAVPARASHTDSQSAERADPSGRVARVSDARGDVSYSPAGEDEWRDVVRNRPLIRGDRLTDNGADEPDATRSGK